MSGYRDSEVLGFSCETHTTPVGQPKNVSRVVIVNDRGERVLDTYIKPQLDGIPVKPGIRSQLLKLSSQQAESIEIVRERVFHIIRGKKLVGYHLSQKMAEFGLFDHGKVDGVLQQSLKHD